MTTITGYSEFACTACGKPVHITHFGSINSFRPPGLLDDGALVNGTLGGDGHGDARCQCGHSFRTEDAKRLCDHVWEPLKPLSNSERFWLLLRMLSRSFR